MASAPGDQSVAPLPRPSCLGDLKILNHRVHIKTSTSHTAPLPECPLLECWPFFFFIFFLTLFSLLIENMTSCPQDLMDGARELRKSLTLLESQPVKQSIHTALCVSARKDGAIIPFIRRRRRGRTCTRTGERRLGEGSGDQLKSVIHYCQVHGLLKRGAIKARRWKNVISKQSRLVTSGTNRPFLSRVIVHQMRTSPLGFGVFLHRRRRAAGIWIWNHKGFFYLLIQMSVNA